MQTMQTGTGLSREKQANVEGQLHLEKFFGVVDQIKSDLTNCGKGLPESKRPVFECGSDFFSVKFKRKRVQSILYRFDPEEKTLSRRVNLHRTETVLEGITDFYLTFFPESKSVLYRIELNGDDDNFTDPFV